MLTRDQILASAARETRAVEVKQWGGTVYVRSLGAAEQFAFEQAVEGAGRLRHLSTYLVFTVCDASGEPIFTLDDVAALEAFPFPILNRVFREATRLNRYTTDDAEEMRKNSSAGQDAASLSGSPATSG